VRKAIFAVVLVVSCSCHKRASSISLPAAPPEIGVPTSYCVEFSPRILMRRPGLLCWEDRPEHAKCINTATGKTVGVPKEAREELRKPYRCKPIPNDPSYRAAH
jgi:hypothetical protein